MKNLDFQAELKKIMEDKRLVEIYFHRASSFGVCYIISVNVEYITLAIIGHNEVYLGVAIFPMSEVESIAIDTTYLKSLEKLLADNSLYKKALNDVKDIEEFTFDGFISSIEEIGTYAELHLEDERMFVKIVNYNDDILAVDEYADNRKGIIAHTYYKRADIVRMVFKTPSLRMVEIAQTV